MPDRYSKARVAQSMRVWLVASLLWLAAGISAFSAHAQSRPLLAADVAKAIAEYAEPAPGRVGQLLAGLGADSNVLPPGFEGLSSMQQIQWAYDSAELAQAGQGEAFLSALVARVAQGAPSLQRDPEVARFLATAQTGEWFKFAQRPANAPAIATDPAVARVIAIVSDAVGSRGSGFTAMSVMERRLGLSRNEVLETLMRFSSGRDALANTLARLPNPPQKQRLAEIALEVMQSAPSARSDRVLGEAVFRWLGLADQRYGEWAQIRDTMIEATEAGKMNAPAEKKTNAKLAVSKIRMDLAEMIHWYFKRDLVPTPEAIERMYFEYTRRNPDAAALFGFATIGLKKDIDAEQYVPELAGRLKARILGRLETETLAIFERSNRRSATSAERAEVKRLVADQYGKSEDWAALARKAGVKPFMGYAEYARLTGFGSLKDAVYYFETTPVGDAVERLCPV
jgi:hypothetical protein